MNILYFHQHFTTPEGVGGIRSYAMARKLIERGHNVTMVCGSHRGGNTGLQGKFRWGRREGVVDDIYVIEFDLPYSNHHNFLQRTRLFVLFALRSIGLALFKKYDVLFASSTPLTVGIPGIFARWFRRKKFVFEIRDLWPELPRKMGVIKNPIILKMMAVLEWACYNSATRLIGLSPGIVDGIHRLGIPKNKIVMIPNGCDLQFFSEKKYLWRPPGVQQNDCMAVFTGTHGVANGLDAVLDVAGVLKRRGRNNIKIVLIGDGKLKEKLQLRATQEDLSNIIFHPPVAKQKIVALLAAADIGLQILADIPAFYYGTSPNKFFDYIATGLPVINNYPGWIADMLRENKCGISIPPNDAELFADAIEQCADDCDFLKNMRKNALVLAEHEFDRNKLSEHFVDWIETSLSV